MKSSLTNFLTLKKSWFNSAHIPGKSKFYVFKGHLLLPIFCNLPLNENCHQLENFKKTKMAPTDSEIHKEFFDKISKNDLNGVKAILSNNNLKTEIYDENGMTPLQHAAYRGNKDIVRFLLDQGANVNSGKHEYGYTALHFAALSGNADICQLLLENGARIHTNSVGRTPSQMAAFVGNHACVAAISNFVPKSDIEYYTTISGFETEPRLPLHLSDPLHKFVMQVNLNPVRIAMNLQKSKSLYENIEKVKNVLELMSEREMKRGFETNEIMSFKFHYLGCILGEIIRCKKLQQNQIQEKKNVEEKSDKETKKVEPTELFIKKMLKISKGPLPEYQESFLKECIREFPNRNCTIFAQMVSTLARSDSSSALSVIICAINGQRGFVNAENLCVTCSQEKADKKCSKCKAVQYCDRECQRLHWFVHKKSCDRLANGIQLETTTEKDKQEVVSAIVSEMNTLKMNEIE